ncbi:MAG: putative RNA methyltransferase [Oscillospiraceae bacterium]
MPQLICPKCGRPLSLEVNSYRCESGHCYDRARSGYVNLLPPAPAGRRHGDDKLMVKARTAFLDKGYYDPLSDAISGIVDAFAGETVRIVDAGCGEGKYTVDILCKLNAAGKRAEIVGVDISREALIQAARRSKDLTLCVASTAHVPLADGWADVVLNIFSPFMAGEFARVLRPGGRLLRVVPLERHLWELKELVYDRPLPNPPMDMAAEGFRIAEQRELCYEIELCSGEDIMSLFRMTPYYYKTGAADQEKAAGAAYLKTTVQFGICVYEKL